MKEDLYSRYKRISIRQWNGASFKSYKLSETTYNKYLHNTNIFARYIQYGHGNIPLYSKYTFIITYRRVFLSELGHYLYLHRPLRDVFDEE